MCEYHYEIYSFSIGPRPEYPQTTVEKGASAFELDFVCLIVCLFVSKYSNLSPHPPLSPLVWNSKKFAVLNKKKSFRE